MKDWREISGKEIETTNLEILQRLISAISEGVISESQMASGGRNIFGRKCQIEIGNHLPFIRGFAANGLRAAAISPLHEAMAIMPSLIREKLAALMFCEAEDAARSKTLGNDLEGCFQFVSTNPQQTIDCAIISHRIAELALIPGLNIFTNDGTSLPVIFPNIDPLRGFLGSPDDKIGSPTPSQQVLFGTSRRRIPNWFSADHPGLLGALKNQHFQALENVSSKLFFLNHLPEICEKVIVEYNQTFGRDFQALQSYKIKGADCVIVSSAIDYETLKEVVDKWRSKRKKVGALKLNLINPLPRNQVSSLLGDKNQVILLEEEGYLTKTIESTRPKITKGKRKTSWVSLENTSVGIPPDTVDLIIDSVLAGPQEFQQPLIINSNLHSTSSPYPKKEILLQTIHREYPNVKSQVLNINPGGDANNSVPNDVNLQLPLAVRKQQDLGPPYTQLSKFYDHTGVLFQAGQQDQVSADPFQALSFLPSSTSHFSPVAELREIIPQLTESKCTGCGICYTECPHGAIQPGVQTFEELLKGVMTVARKRGLDVVKLTPHVKNIAKLADKRIRNSESVESVKGLLTQAWKDFLKNSKLGEEKIDELDKEMEVLKEILTNFQASVTDLFYLKGGAQQNGSSLLFSLAVDPNSCTGCGKCSALCPENAFEMVPETMEITSVLQNRFELNEELPTTSSDVISKGLDDLEISPFSPAMLNKDSFNAMGGGNGKVDNFLTKSFMHLIVSTLESVRRLSSKDLEEEIGQLVQSLSEKIHNELSGELPEENLEALYNAVKDTKDSKMSFEEVVHGLNEVKPMKPVDVAVLRRRMALVHDLKELQWLITDGPTGNGRARFSLILNPATMDWSVKYPFNNFQVPVVIQSRYEPASHVGGLLQGALRHYLDIIRLMRRAALEAKGKYRPEIHDREIISLEWKDLNESERSFLPPMIWVTDSQGLNDLERFRSIANDLPLQIILLDKSNLAAPNLSLLLSALTNANYSVYQGSLGNQADLFKTLKERLLNGESSIFFLSIPENLRDEHPSLLQFSDLALKTRVHPIVNRNLRESSGFLSRDISLSENPSHEKMWHSENIHYVSKGEDHSFSYTFTPPDWYFELAEFDGDFEQLEDYEGYMPVADYLKLDDEARKDKFPMIMKIGSMNELIRYRVPDKIVAICEANALVWKNIRELAGLETPFPEKLREKVIKELTVKYEEEIAELKRQYEEKLQNNEAVTMSKVQVRLRDKLLELARKKELKRQ